jgi:hypothetical protein
MPDAQNFLAWTATPTREVSARSVVLCRAAAQRISGSPLIASMHRALCLREYQSAVVLLRPEPHRDLVERKPRVSACEDIFRIERHEPVANIVRVPSADSRSSQTQSLTLGALAQAALAIRTNWNALIAQNVDAACNSFARTTYPAKALHGWPIFVGWEHTSSVPTVAHGTFMDAELSNF